MLSNNGLRLRSTRSKFRPISNFTYLHNPTLAARSYLLLSYGIDNMYYVKQ